MSAVRLSFCIATLNRAKFIGETLAGIVNQITPEVEIVVVDGASTDNTEEVVKGIAARCPGLRYVRLAQKGGVDQDYCKAVELARGEYCWLFTDDDLIQPGAVAAVLEAIRKQYSLIVVNAEVRTPDLGCCLQAQRIVAASDRVYSSSVADRNRLLAEAGLYLSFIGGVVIRRELWNQREKAKFFGTEFVHVGVIFQSPLPGEALVMAYPWVVIRYGNAQWTSRSFAIWMFKWPDLIWSLADFSDEAKQRVEARHPWRSWQRLLMARVMGQFSLKEHTDWLQSRFESSGEKFFSRLIATAPIGPLNLLARCYARWILRKNPSIGLFELESWARRNKSAK